MRNYIHGIQLLWYNKEGDELKWLVVEVVLLRAQHVVHRAEVDVPPVVRHADLVVRVALVLALLIIQIAVHHVADIVEHQLHLPHVQVVVLQHVLLVQVKRDAQADHAVVDVNLTVRFNAVQHVEMDVTLAVDLHVSNHAVLHAVHHLLVIQDLDIVLAPTVRHRARMDVRVHAKTNVVIHVKIHVMIHARMDARMHVIPHVNIVALVTALVNVLVIADRDA